MHFLYDRASSVLARVSSSLSLFPSVGLVLPRTFSACGTSPLSGSQVAGTLREPGEPTLRGGHVCLGSHPSSCVIWQLSLLYWLTPKIKAALVIEPPPSDLEIQQQKIWNYVTPLALKSSSPGLFVGFLSIPWEVLHYFQPDLRCTRSKVRILSLLPMLVGPGQFLCLPNVYISKLTFQKICSFISDCLILYNPLMFSILGHPLLKIFRCQVSLLLETASQFIFNI